MAPVALSGKKEFFADDLPRNIAENANFEPCFLIALPSNDRRKSLFWLHFSTRKRPLISKIRENHEDASILSAHKSVNRHAPFYSYSWRRPLERGRAIALKQHAASLRGGALGWRLKELVASLTWIQSLFKKNKTPPAMTNLAMDSRAFLLKKDSRGPLLRSEKSQTAGRAAFCRGALMHRPKPVRF